MEYKDYYKILGLEKNATDSDIKKEYRKLARKYHPDVSKASDAEEKFKAINEAYDVLKDADKRAEYDHMGSAGQSRTGGFSGSPNYRGGPNFGNIFEDLFGGNDGSFTQSYSSGGASARKGQDIRSKVSIDIEDSINGVTRSFNLTMSDANKQRTLKVKIPKGIQEGQTIRLTGQGAPGMGRGSSSGDLLLEVVFNKHHLYSVEGKDIYLDAPVMFWEAALGTKIKIPTPTGEINLKIPADSQHGRKFRLKQKGLPTKDPGDFYVVLKVMLPPTSDPQAKAFYEQIQDELSYNPRNF